MLICKEEPDISIYALLARIPFDVFVFYSLLRLKGQRKSEWSVNMVRDTELR